MKLLMAKKIVCETRGNLPLRANRLPMLGDSGIDDNGKDFRPHTLRKYDP